MSILVVLENANKQLKKPSLEALTYARKLGEALKQPVKALALGGFDAEELNKVGQYGVSELIHVNDDAYTDFTSTNYTRAISQISSKENAEIIIFPQGYYGRAVAPRVAIKLDYAFLSGIFTLLTPSDNGYSAKRIAFSNKGIETVQTHSTKVVLTVRASAFLPEEAPTSLNITTQSIPAEDTREKVLGREVATGRVPLQEAEIVVSAGRGLKGPENWKMIEELAELLNATLACSKPVADMGWRPHHEHVGQTGIQISPNIYIAIGISGAIQHLAGVASSRTIIVINKDPEAPFFQNCDYGIVGDAFEVVPKLIDAIKARKK